MRARRLRASRDEDLLPIECDTPVNLHFTAQPFIPSQRSCYADSAKLMPNRSIRAVFFACGPGDTINAHRAWRAGKPEPTQLSVTFSAEVADFVETIGAQGIFVSQHARVERLVDDRFVIEHCPKPWPKASGVIFHFREIWYGAMLAVKALRYRCDFAIIDSGTTHPFACILFRCFGMRIVYVMHNTRWPKGNRPSSLMWRFIHRLDGLFFARFASAALCVSPECMRQVSDLAGRSVTRVLAFRPRYDAERLGDVAPTPPHGRRPFRIVFVGRLTHDKGVLDLPFAARLVEAEIPGQVIWSVWGQGDAESELQLSISTQGVGHCMHYCGWAAPAR